MKKILITGVNGLVGSELYQYFKHKFEVWGLDIYDRNVCDNFIKSDITNLAILEKSLSNFKFDIVINCAAIAHNDKNEFSYDDFIRVNANGTKNLLKALDNNKPEKFILFSTVAVYGEYGYTEAIDESFPTNPITDYAKSKELAEEYCRNSSIKTIVLRFPAIYSEKLLKDFSKRIMLKGGLAFRFGNGKQEHTFCHIETVKQQVEFVLDKTNISEPVIQMGDGFNYTSEDLLLYFNSYVKIVLPFPHILFRLLIFGIGIIFRNKKKTLETIYWKLFKNNVYSIKKLLSLGFEPQANKIN